MIFDVMSYFMPYPRTKIWEGLGHKDQDTLKAGCWLLRVKTKKGILSVRLLPMFYRHTNGYYSVQACHIFILANLWQKRIPILKL